jgi:hypothetical protein
LKASNYAKRTGQEENLGRKGGRKEGRGDGVRKRDDTVTLDRKSKKERTCGIERYRTINMVEACAVGWRASS